MLLEPLLRALYGVHWGNDLPDLLSTAGLDMVEVRSIWPQFVQAIVASKRRDQ